MRIHTPPAPAWRAARRRVWATALPLTLMLLLLPSLAGCVEGNCGTHITNSLAGVFALSTDDAWAVGGASANGDELIGLVEHWDGARWMVVPSPTIDFPGGGFGGSPPPLDAVAGSSSHDVWVVGETSIGGSGPVIEHWDGQAWRASSSPCPSCGASRLNAVTALSAIDAWAVGAASAPSQTASSSRPLVERWDGATWQVAPGSESISSDGALNSVIALSDSEVWVFGVEKDYAPLIARWDGKRWQVIANEQSKGTLHLPLVVPNAPLRATAAPAPTRALSNEPPMWIVASAYSLCATCNQPLIQGNPLILTGAGARWTSVPASQLPTEFQIPDQVTLEAGDAVSATDVWAVGSYQPQGAQRSLAGSAYIIHWDGARWVSQPRQQRRTSDALFALSATSASDVWAVGASASAGGAQYTLIEHWDGSRWTVVPSPNPGARVANVCM